MYLAVMIYTNSSIQPELIFTVLLAESKIPEC